MSSVQTVPSATSASRYARCVENSKRIRWDIDRDVIRDRAFAPGEKFLPDSLSMVERLADLLNPEERRFLGRIQGRTYANMFALVERYVGAKMLELSRDHWLGDQDAMEALVRFTDEELKHQALFRRIEALAARIMPVGYLFGPEPNMVAQFVLGKCTWAVLALTCHLELVTQVHYRESIGTDPEVSPLFKDVFLFHWKEESQHAVVDELEWLREDAKLDADERDRAVDDFIALVIGVDGMLQAQADADARYFVACGPQPGVHGPEAAERIRASLLAAYRWQYILSGAAQPHFNELLSSLITPAQGQRIHAALAGLQ
ncbi:hypothetical protein [Variovorax sp. JS1663]|uniref:hypothetical protein n=1 Tax=Variovorax sp. JS1663 TaxID=1851577 RepID=UPI000B344524|nr:hypothetical protein [Variovorax sp. JS1663]OUM00322.1 hypothetical protein A8M77_21820 [Variovorax sp. JS1663]